MGLTNVEWNYYLVLLEEEFAPVETGCIGAVLGVGFVYTEVLHVKTIIQTMTGLDRD